jgi:hypothetical protein
VAEVVGILSGVDVGVLRVVHVHLLPEQNHALHSETKYVQQQSKRRLPNCELTHCSRHTLGHRTLKAFRAPGDILNTDNFVGKGGQHYQVILWLPLSSFPEKDQHSRLATREIEYLQIWDKALAVRACSQWVF